MGTTWAVHIYKLQAGAVCCLSPYVTENCPDFQLRVISLKRFRLLSQKVVSISPVRDALQRDIDKGKEFIFENEKKKIENMPSQVSPTHK